MRCTQVAQGTYNLDANLTVLRLYQINPAATNSKVVANILLKALMQLPKPDFQLCVYQLSEKAQASAARHAHRGDRSKKSLRRR